MQVGAFPSPVVKMEQQSNSQRACCGKEMTTSGERVRHGRWGKPHDKKSVHRRSPDGIVLVLYI